jgi:PAS domain-containing protein
MIASIKQQAPEIEAHFVSCSGLAGIDRALDGIAEYRGDVPIFLELLACEGGCVNGPRAERRSGSVAKRLSILEYAAGAANRALAADLDLSERRESRPVTAERFSEERLREALRLVGKLGPEDEFDCAGCGYDSCRAFAAAMLSGRAERTMCVSYTRDLAQKKADALVRAMPSGVVVVDSGLGIAECNANFAALLGPDAQAIYEAKPGMAGADLRRLAPFADLFASVLAEGGPEHIDRDLRIGNRILHASVFAIEAGSYAGGVFQDITVPWIRRDRVVAQAKSVIDKNLRTVQKIAYLLGENAADTEAILDSLIESFSAEERDGGGR